MGTSIAKNYGNIYVGHFVPPGFRHLLAWLRNIHNLYSGRSQKNGNNKGDPKVKCLLVTKRERWVEYLHQKREQRPKRVFKGSAKRKIAKTKYTQIEVRERIANIITAPNAAWAKRKKTEPYSIPRNYFGQYA